MLPALTPRLRCVYEMVEGKAVADIGTDHALLPAALVLSGRCARAVASDIVPGPLERARATLAEYGCAASVETVLCDGIGKDAAACDTVVIAGMGGLLIADIISRAFPVPPRPELQLLLQPMTKAAELRAFLTENGWAITRERFACEGRKAYAVIEARPGRDAPYSPAELVSGRFCEGADALAWLALRLNSLSRRERGLREGGQTAEAERLGKIIEELRGKL